MRLLNFVSQASALFFILTGVIIACNDLLVGNESALPVVSAIVSIIFIGAGLLLLLLGKSAADLSCRVAPEGMRAYKRLRQLLSILFSAFLFSGMIILYGVITRIGQGFAIFG